MCPDRDIPKKERRRVTRPSNFFFVDACKTYESDAGYRLFLSLHHHPSVTARARRPRRHRRIYPVLSSPLRRVKHILEDFLRINPDPPRGYQDCHRRVETTLVPGTRRTHSSLDNYTHTYSGSNVCATYVSDSRYLGGKSVCDR